MSAPLSPIPNDAGMVDQTLTISKRWYIWLFEVWQRIRLCIALAGPVYTKSNQSASIVTATVATIIQSGLYRISYRQRVTTPATTNSSLTPTIGWREGGVTQSASGAAMTGNTTTTQQNGVFFVRCDSGTVITAAFLYASTGATAMVFNADVAVELVN